MEEIRQDSSHFYLEVELRKVVGYMAVPLGTQGDNLLLVMEIGN
jgi:hypothetical protein